MDGLQKSTFTSTVITYTLVLSLVSEKPTVLLIDDDPSHLQLYSWVLARGGFRAVTALVNGDGLELPRTEPIELIVLDYQLGRVKSVDVARKLGEVFPAKPVLVLSDMQWLPDDIAPYATAFVRKGEPEQLLTQVHSLLKPSQL
jgi:DNA-binding response OmpR family regulator